MKRIVFAAACIGMLAVNLAGAAEPQKSSVPSAGGPQDAPVNTSRSNKKTSNDAVAPTQTYSGATTANPGTAGPQNAPISTSRSNK